MNLKIHSVKTDSINGLYQIYVFREFDGLLDKITIPVSLFGDGEPVGSPDHFRAIFGGIWVADGLPAPDTYYRYESQRVKFGEVTKNEV